MSETELVKSMLQAVNHYGYFWRNNTGASKIESSRGTRFIRFGLPGASDIVGVCQGRFVAIEVKSKRGKQSEQQKLFEQYITTHGGCYILAYNVDDALKVLLTLKQGKTHEQFTQRS